MLPALTLLVFLGALGAWSLMRPTPRTLLLGGGVLAATQITGSLVALGLLGQLSRLPVIAVNAAASLLLIVLTRKSLLHALLTQRASLRDFGHMLRVTPALAIATAVLLLAILWTLFLGLVLPPTDWDGLAQNLPMAAFHVQNGDIAPIETPYRGIRAYPQGGALLLAYTMLLSGSDTAVDLAQFPFWLMGTLAVYALARTLAASRANALAGALLFAAAPVVMLQARTAYFDLEVAAIALAALALLLDQQVGLRSRAFVAGAAAGLLADLKYAGLIYALVLLVLLVLALVVERIPGRTSPVQPSRSTSVRPWCWAAAGMPGISPGIRTRCGPCSWDLGGRTILPGVWTLRHVLRGRSAGADCSAPTSPASSPSGAADRGATRQMSGLAAWARCGRPRPARTPPLHRPDPAPPDTLQGSLPALHPGNLPAHARELAHAIVLAPIGATGVRGCDAGAVRPALQAMLVAGWLRRLPA